jgi:basic membrane lipoprotein Med (substrate-binding protein (PBP1-ABC) superfamily)
VPTTTTAAATASTVEEDAAFDYSAFDANGDGVITIGVAAAGPADDGAYYQAVVDAAIELSEANGFEAPIVVDKIEAANAATELSNLAEQGVDIIIVGASEIAEPLPDLTEKYSDIFWYCNCGAGFASLPGLAQSLDDSSEISYTAGYASGLLLQDRGSTVAYFIGCCDLNFEMEALLSFEMGLQAVDSAFTVTYVPTGDWPYDFDNVPNATEAFNTAVAEGAGVVYPYLGGAHEAIVQLANENGVAALSAGPSDVCTREGDLTWDIAVRFDGGDYVAAIFPQIFAGDVVEGETKVFRVGVDSEPGAVICNATADQQAAMDSVYAEIASGAFAGEFGAIKGAAYGGWTVEEDAAFDYSAFDANGDGVITIGVAAAGPADDGAYYQAVVDAAIELSEANGFEAPIVVDKIEAANAATELSNLAEQGVDIIIVGASEIAEPLPDLTEKYSDIFWYCNCGAGFASLPGLAQSLDDSSEISYTAGYASGLLLQDRGSTVAYFIGCCDLNFEMEALLSFEMGLQAVDSAFTVTYVPTGDWPYDFDNVPNATEAFNTAVAEGAGVVYPYLGGAHEAIVQLANENGVAALSAGPSDVCTREGDLTWDIAVRFDGGDYVAAIFPQIFAGDVVEGETKVFRVGVDSEPGAVICNATADQQAAMDSVYAEIASGAFAGEFGAIKGAAYGG